MNVENDGVDEFVGRGVQVSVTIMAQIARELLKLRDAKEERERRELAYLEQRLDMERTLARTQYLNIDNVDWWKNSQPADVVALGRLAHAWRDHDAQAVHAFNKISERCRTFYGESFDELSARVDRETYGEKPATNNSHETLKGSLSTTEKTGQSNPKEQQEALSQSLTGLGIDDKAIEARMGLDLSNAVPGKEVLRHRPRHSQNITHGSTVQERPLGWER